MIIRARKNGCISHRLQQLCILNNISPKALASALGMGNSAYFEEIINETVENDKFDKGTIMLLSKFFDISTDFFEKPIIINNKLDTHDVFFIKDKFLVSNKDISKINIIREWVEWLIRILEKDYIEFPRISLKRYSRRRPYTVKEIFSIAQKIRRTLRIHGPIKNIFEILENKGFILAKIPKDMNISAAIKTYRLNLAILFFKGNDELTRINLATTLGHYILHSKLTNKCILRDRLEYSFLEDEAKWFAIFFLAPTLRGDLRRINIIYTEDMQYLQDRWGIPYVDLLHYIRYIKPAIKFEIDFSKLSSVSNRYKNQEITILRDSLKLVMETLNAKNDFCRKIPFYKNYIEEISNLPRGFLEYKNK